MFKTEYVMLVVGMAAVTYFPRWFPLSFLTRKHLPQWLLEWLDLIPVAILSALVVPELLTEGAPRHLELIQVKAFVALPTFLFAMKTKSLGATVLFGMLLYWIAGKVV